MCDILWYLSLNFLAEENSSQTWNLRSFRTIPLILPPIKGQARLAITSPLPCLMVESPGILEIHKKMAPKTHQKKSSGESPLGIRWRHFPFKESMTTSDRLRAHSPPWSTRRRMPWLQCCRRCGASRQGGVEKSKKTRADLWNSDIL